MTEPFGALFVSAVPNVAESRCLNSRHHDADCNACVTLCPVMAIGLPGLTPEIDFDGCVMCGVCVAVCPTGAISVPQPIRTALGTAAASVDADAIGVVCPYHSDPSRSSAPAQTILRHGMCLGSLDPGGLLELAKPEERSVWLDVSECASCSIASAAPLIENSVGVANRLAWRPGRPDPIGLVAEPATGSRKRVIEGAHQGMTRRGLFALGKPGTVEIDEPMVRAGGAVGDRLPTVLPRKRRRLLEQLERWEAGGQAVALEGTGFTVVRVDPELCSACGLCGVFCPTGSLGFHLSPGEFALGFRVSLCIDCGICAVACPENAVSFESEADSVLASDWSVILSGSQTNCSVCRQPTRGKPGERVSCYACRDASPGVVPGGDGGGLMDGLSRPTR